MPSTTFVARRPGPFSALVQAAEIGGVRLDPLAPVRTHDRYYDTETGDLLRHGLALRVREQGGRRTAGLRPVETATEPLPDDLDLLGSDIQGVHLTLPPGSLALAVRKVTGDAALEPLLSLRQYRTPRVAREGEEKLGVLSFDVVVYEVPGSRVVSNEVEVRDDSDLIGRLASVFEEEGLETATRSKFARAVLRHPRTLSQPVLLLPDEARLLEEAAATGEIQIRRRASVALLDARGFRPDTIAAQTGMSMARVKHWRQRFREVRLGVLEPETLATPVRRPASRVAAVRPSEPSMEGHASAPTSGSPQSPPHRPVPAAPEAERPKYGEPASDRVPSGDGSPGHPTELADMAELLELFSPSSPDTPMLSEDAPGDDLDDEAGEVEEVALPFTPRNPYPVVLGPVPTEQRAPSPRSAPTPEPVVAPVPEATAPAPPQPAVRAEPVVPPHAPAQPSAPTPVPPPVRLVPPVATVAAPPAFAVEPADPLHDPFAEIDLRTLRADRGTPLSARYQAIDEPAGDGIPDAPVSRVSPLPSEAAPVPPQARGGQTPLDGDTPLPLAARRTIGEQLVRFEAQASTFLTSRAPSDARKLLIAAQRLRLTVETFARTLPHDAAQRLVASLRPLVDDLDAGLDYARGVALAPDRQDLARLSGASIASAAARLGSGRHRAWGDRSRRLLAHLDHQHEQGLRMGDFAATPPDDFVGEPGDMPTPTRLRHILGSTVWGRFEAIRAFQDDLDHLTPDLAAHLAVALSGLRFVLGLVEQTGEGYVADIAAALDAAEREVARARHRAVGAALGVAPGTVTDELAVVAQVWAEVAAAPFKKRLATVIAAV